MTTANTLPTTEQIIDELISIDPSIFASSGVFSAMTMGAQGYNPIGNITIAGGSSGYTHSTTPSTITLTGASNAPYWTNSSNSPNLTVSGNAEIEGDLKVGGRSIVDSLEKIEQRLAILVPDPKRLAKFEALKEAYEHYKTLEALCVEVNVDPSKK